MATSFASPTSRRAAATTARFSTAPSSSTSSSSNAGDEADNDAYDDGIPLPFPAALPRSDFLAPVFQPAAYLSALPHRHQTLEDLRTDLRDRSASISAELLELVNSNYTAFLSLGAELQGGDEKVEGVRVAMLGFRRAVEDVKSKVSAREETQGLNEDLRSVRASIEKGRQMIEVSERVSSLEERLAMDSLSGTSGYSKWKVDESDLEDADEEEEQAKSDGLLGSSPVKLAALAKDCSQVTTLIARLDQDHPFVIKLEERLARCRNTLLLDLSNALREAKSAGIKGQDRLLKYLGIYRMLDAQDEAVKALRGR